MKPYSLDLDRYVRFSLENGIMISTYQDFGEPITFEIAQAMIRKRLELQNGIAYAQLIIGPKKIIFDKKAKALLASEEGMAGIVRAAILISNRIVATIAQAFIKLKKLDVLVKIFWNIDDAMRWLAEPLRYSPAKEFNLSKYNAPLPNMTYQKYKGKDTSRIQRPTIWKKKNALTEKELQIIKMIADDGLSPEKVALVLNRSKRTVEKHLEHMRRKTGTDGIVQLIAWWHKRTKK